MAGRCSVVCLTHPSCLSRRRYRWLRKLAISSSPPMWDSTDGLGIENRDSLGNGTSYAAIRKIRCITFKLTRIS